MTRAVSTAATVPTISTTRLFPLVILVGNFPYAHPSIAFLFRAWATPTLLDGSIMAGLGLIWAGGVYFLARAYSVVLASVVALFELVALPIIWGFILWQELSGWTTWAGASLALFSGLYVLYREQRERPSQIGDI